MQSDNELITPIQGHAFKGQGHRQQFKKMHFSGEGIPSQASPQINENLFKLQLLGDFVNIPVPGGGGVPLYPLEESQITYQDLVGSTNFITLPAPLGTISGCELGINGIGDSYYTAGERTDPNLPFAWKVRYSNGTVVEQQMVYSNWHGNEPNDQTQSCSAIGANTDFNYQWFDLQCTHAMCFLCEIDP